MVFHQVVSHQGSLSSGWYLIRMLIHQSGISLGRSRVVSHEGGLSLGLSSRVVCHQGGLLP